MHRTQGIAARGHDTHSAAAGSREPLVRRIHAQTHGATGEGHAAQCEPRHVQWRQRCLRYNVYLGSASAKAEAVRRALRFSGKCALGASTPSACARWDKQRGTKGLPRTAQTERERPAAK